jgi:hypothetical protein
MEMDTRGRRLGTAAMGLVEADSEDELFRSLWRQIRITIRGGQVTDSIGY